ncbi:MAG: hypothetical protein AAF589_06660 [Planctomycetota bacterium]
MADTTRPDETPDLKSQRLDQPHMVQPKGAAASAKQLAASSSDPSPLPLGDDSPIANQASSLAARLAEQQAELDRRAELIAAEEADIESKLRSARLWFDEQHQAMEERTEALDQREAALDRPLESMAIEPNADSENDQQALSDELAAREAELDARQANLYEQIDKLTEDRARFGEREAKLDARQSELDRLWQELTEQRSVAEEQRRDNEQASADVEKSRAELFALQAELDNQQVDLAARETQISARQAEVQAAIKRFEMLGVTEQRVADLTKQADEFTARSRHLDSAEALLTEEKTAVEEDRRELESQRKQTQEQLLIERRRIEAERAEVNKMASQHEQRSAAKEAELDQRQAALEQLQGELQAGQREVLEMRLATEETWAQLAGALAPATLTRSIAQVRAKLADHYQHTLQEIADRRRQLDEISKQLATEHGRIDEQKAKIQQWAARREEDIEQRAARLIARERELDRQQQHYERLEIRWAAEREELRDKVRILYADLRHEPLGEAA